jgi:hypothetical protein
LGQCSYADSELLADARGGHALSPQFGYLIPAEDPPLPPEVLPALFASRMPALTRANQGPLEFRRGPQAVQQEP